MRSFNLSSRMENLPTDCVNVLDFGCGPDARAPVTGTGTYGPGGLTLATTAVDNNAAFILPAAKVYIPAAQKSRLFRSRLLFTHVAASNVFVGETSSAVGATLVGDDGAGILANQTGWGFYKVEGDTYWWAFLSNGTTQTKTQLTAANSLNKVAQLASSSAYQTFQVGVFPKTATKADVVFEINGQQVAKVTDWIWTSALAVGPAIAVKAGSAGIESLIASYIATARTRV